MDTPVLFPTFQHLVSSHSPKLSDFLEKGVSLTIHASNINTKPLLGKQHHFASFVELQCDGHAFHCTHLLLTSALISRPE